MRHAHRRPTARVFSPSSFPFVPLFVPYQHKISAAFLGYFVLCVFTYVEEVVVKIKHLGEDCEDGHEVCDMVFILKNLTT